MSPSLAWVPRFWRRKLRGRHVRKLEGQVHELDTEIQELEGQIHKLETNIKTHGVLVRALESKTRKLEKGDQLRSRIDNLEADVRTIERESRLEDAERARIEELERQIDEVGQERKLKLVANSRRQDETSRPPPALLDLQHTMDPLIASRVYNIKYSRLCQMPEELLLLMIRFLEGDPIALLSLRRVSRVFRRLIYEQSLWGPIRALYSHGGDVLSEAYWRIPQDQVRKFQQYLQSDEMCDSCKHWCDIPGGGCLRRMTASGRLPQWKKPDAKFKSHGILPLHCDECDGCHDVLEFSYSHRNQAKRHRKCLGRRGAVQLCEHVHVSWAAVEAHILYWQQRCPGDWRECFDHMVTECHHPSHDMRCSAGEPPTWPRARLEGESLETGWVFLRLEWAPHCRFDSFTLRPDGRVPAPQLRALFEKYRRSSPARILLPSYPSSPLPEMVCFDPSTCSCLHYDAGAGDGDKTLSATDRLAWRTSFFQGVVHECESPHYFSRVSPMFGSWGEVQISKHWPGSKSDMACMITTYSQKIPVCRKMDSGKLKPTRNWLYAMDPDTYPHQPGKQCLPQCKDKSCMNYYRRPLAFLQK